MDASMIVVLIKIEDSYSLELVNPGVNKPMAFQAVQQRQQTNSTAVVFTPQCTRQRQRWGVTPHRRAACVLPAIFVDATTSEID